MRSLRSRLLFFIFIDLITIIHNTPDNITINNHLKQLLNDSSKSYDQAFSFNLSNISPSCFAKYVFANNLSLLYLIFSIVTAIIWISLLICFASHCCLFDSKVRYGLWGILSFWLTYLPFISIILFSFLFFNQIKIYNDELSILSSSFTNFTKHTKLGYPDGEENKFKGFQNIDSYFTNLINGMNSLAIKGKQIFATGSNFFEKSENFEKILFQIDLDSKTKVINPQTKLIEITPKFYDEFSLYQLNSITSKISKEYENKIKKTYNELNEIHTKTKNLDNEKGNQKEIILIKEAGKIINQINSTFYDNTYTLQRDFTLYVQASILLSNFFKIMFYVFTLLILSCLFFLFIYFYVKNLCVKKLLHVIWNLLTLSVVILSIGASTFMIMSYFSKKSLYSLNMMITTSDTSQIYQKYINICLNSNGNLFSALQLEKCHLNLIDNDISELIEKMNKLSVIKNNNFFDQAKTKLDNYYKNWFLSSAEIDVNSFIAQINNITNNIENDLDKCNTKDIWVTTKDKCIDGYIYLPKIDIEKREHGKKYCLNIPDKYTPYDLYPLYQENCNLNQLDILYDIIPSLSQYYWQNINILDQLNNHFLLLEEQYKKLRDEMNSQIQKVKENLQITFQPLSNFHDTISLEAIFNCGELKRDLIQYYDTSYNEFSDICYNVSKTLISCSLIGLIGILFLISSIYRNSEEATQLYYDLLESRIMKNNDKNDIELIEK